VCFGGGVSLWVGNHDGFGRTDGQLKSFAAHALEEDAEVENPSSAQFERLGGGAGKDGKCHIGLCFFVDTVTDDLRGEFRALTTSERRVVGVYVNRNCGRIDRRRLKFGDLSNSTEN